MSGDKICIDRDTLRKMLKMLKELSELIEKYYDELDLYILTLEIMLEEDEEERKVVATARNIEELKKALEYDD
jgi:mevalonate kinase